MIIVIFNSMAQIYVGTAYNQVYCVPVDPKQDIAKLGEKKRSPVTSISTLNYSGQIAYSNPQ